MIEDLIIKYGAHIAMAIRIATFFILLLQIIPLQIREAGVKNGLGKLRILLLIMGFSLFVANTIALWLIFFTFQNLGGSASTRLIQIASALFLLIPAIALYYIYHQQYTPEAKRVHVEVDKQEKKAAKRQTKFDDKRKEDKRKFDLHR